MHLRSFVDDATLYSSSPSIVNLTNCLNDNLKNFKDWCIRNNMVINVPKTKAMYISSRNAAPKILENCPDLKLSEILQISSNEKLLGVHIDNTLSWTVQVDNTIKMQLLAILTRQNYDIPTNTYQEIVL